MQLLLADKQFLSSSDSSRVAEDKYAELNTVTNFMCCPSIFCRYACTKHDGGASGEYDFRAVLTHSRIEFFACSSTYSKHPPSKTLNQTFSPSAAIRLFVWFKAPGRSFSTGLNFWRKRRGEVVSRVIIC